MAEVQKAKTTEGASLPILRGLSQNVHLKEKMPLIAIQHLLPDTLELIRILDKVGFGPIIIFGIPYSNKQPVIDKLRDEGFMVHTPDLDNLNDPKYWEKTIGPLIESWNEHDKKYAILEDGGYLGDALHKNHDEYLQSCIGSVEQTKKGLWKYQNVERLQIPVYTVADSRLKQIAESPEVGNAIARSIDNSLDEIGLSLSQKKVALLGYGWIGSSVTKALEARGAIVTVYDIDAMKMLEAMLSMNKVSRKDDAIKDADIIIGCTGYGSLCKEDYKIVQSGVILVNATSQYVEFDIEWLYEQSSYTQKTSPSINEFTIYSKKIRVIYDAAPINFASSVSVPPKKMDLVLSEMFLCLQRIINEKNENKIYSIPVKDEQKISEIYLDLYN